MPPSLPEIDINTLIRTLSESRLLSPEHLDSLWHNFRATLDTADALQFLQFLVQTGALTPYQAEQLRSGQASRIHCGSFTLLQPIGKGGLGTVFRAVGQEDRIPYAVKVLPLRNLWNVHLARKLVDRFAVLPAHPAIIPFVAIDSTSWCHYLAWPYAEGETLDRIVARTGPLAPELAAQYGAGIAEGLEICHQHALFHGVLKPANVLISPNHQPRLLDLGVGAILAENLADEESLIDTVSSANTAIGMLDYSPPESSGEQFCLTASADAYGLGGILYFLLSGGPPFPDGTAIDKLMAQQQSEPVSIQRRNPGVPDGFAELIARLLAKSPDARPCDFQQLREELLRYSHPPTLPIGSASLFVVPPGLVPDERTLPPDLQPRHRGPTDSDALSLSSLTRSVGPMTDLNYEIPLFEPIPAIVQEPPPEPVPIRESAPVAPEQPVATAVPVTQPPHIRRSGGTPPRFLWAIWARRVARFLRPHLPRLDVIQASVFGDVQLLPGSESRIQVFFHRPESMAAVQSLAQVMAPSQQLLAVCFPDRPIAEGSTVGVHFSAARMQVVNTLVHSVWTGVPVPVMFTVRVPATCPAGEHLAILSLGLNGILVGRQELQLTVE